MCIELKDIGLSFSNRVILNRVNAVFKKGFNLIYGSSGSGKTSLLKIINMLITPSAGSVLYKEKEIENYEADYWRSMCMLTKQITIFAEGSVIENILMPFEFKVHRGKKLDNRMLNNLLGEFNISEDILDKDIKKLSGGESQRISIIRSILLNPDIFLFDEPTSALDYDTQHKMFAKIKSLSKDKICIVASHSKDALKYGDSIFEVKGGELINV